MDLQSGESPNQTKNPIRPVGSLQRDPVILHESQQQRCVALLLADEQFNYPGQARVLSGCETFCRSQQCPPVRLFAELERCDGACDQLPLIGPENIGKAMRYTASMQGVIFEMIHPNLEISSPHAATS
jgi:hypothetical protein